MRWPTDMVHNLHMLSNWSIRVPSSPLQVAIKRNGKHQTSVQEPRQLDSHRLDLWIMVPSMTRQQLVAHVWAHKGYWLDHEHMQLGSHSVGTSSSTKSMFWFCAAADWGCLLFTFAETCYNHKILHVRIMSVVMPFFVCRILLAIKQCVYILVIKMLSLVC